LCWGAVLAGTVAAIGIHLLLTALGVGAGLATFTPMTDAHPVANFNVGAGIVWSVCAIIAYGLVDWLRDVYPVVRIVALCMESSFGISR